MAWPCFWVEPVDLQTNVLRRYSPRDHYRADRPDGRCPGMTGELSYHHAEHRVDDGPFRGGDDPHREGRVYHRTDADDFLEHPDWGRVARCAGCGRPFTPDDPHQVLGDRYHAWPGDGRMWPLGQVPIGGMFDCLWLPDSWAGADGVHLTVKLPPGGRYDWWHVDGPSSSGGRWARSGGIPLAVVTPSIDSGSYHGFLGSATAPGPGWLSDPL